MAFLIVCFLCIVSFYAVVQILAFVLALFGLGGDEVQKQKVRWHRLK